MKTEDAITVLKELTKNASKRSKIGQMRDLMPYIEEAMKSGVTLADIHAALTDKCGIDIKLMTFIGSYKRIKKERKEKPNKTTAATPLDNTPENEFHNPNKTTEKIAEITKDNDTDNEDLSSLTDKQRRERIADKYMNIGTKNPILQKILDKKKE